MRQTDSTASSGATALAASLTGGGTGDGVADLHVHSSCSDGTFSPAELPRLARQLGLHALALADHDTIDGCEVFAEACAGWGIEFIPATELTTEHNGVEVHILAYYVELQNQVLHAALKRAQAARRARVRQIVARLNRLGIPLTVEAVLGSGKCSSPGRPHVAHALVQSGLCQTYHDAFERYLGKNKPAWVPYPKISSAEAIALIHSVGGLAVAAHPGLSNAESALPHLIAAGLDGIECYHPKHTNAQTARYLRMAASHGLLVTGGSDCHGEMKGEILLGTVRVPYAVAEQLKRGRRLRVEA